MGPPHVRGLVCTQGINEQNTEIITMTDERKYVEIPRSKRKGRKDKKKRVTKSEHNNYKTLDVHHSSVW